MSELTKKSKKEENIDAEEYADLLEKYQFSTKELSPGKLLKGKVIKVTPTYVIVDVGFKSEGIIPMDDFADQQETETLKPGDEVEAVLEKSDLKEGYLILSKKKAMAIKALNKLEKAFQHNSWIVGKITEKIKNGYNVNVGMNVFLPDSHADVKAVKDPSKLIGNLYKFKVIKFDRKTENAVISRKLYLQDEKEKKKRKERRLLYFILFHLKFRINKFYRFIILL